MERQPAVALASRAGAALLAFSLLASCAATQEDIAQQSGRMDDLQARLIRLERSSAESKPNRPDQSVPPDIGQRLADLRQHVETLDNDLRKQVENLRKQVESVEKVASDSRKASNTPSRLPELEAKVTALSDKVRALEARPATASAGPSFAPPPPAQPSQQARTSPGPANAQTTVAPGAEPERPRQPPKTLYDASYALYKQGKYEEARESFREYIRQYPETNLTGNAYFWIGESFYDQGQYEQAILEYDKVVQKFPTGDKVTSALLKQAFAFDAINDPVDAKILLKKILREHPTSEQAAIAKKKLEMLGE